MKIKDGSALKTPMEQLNSRLDCINSIVYRSDVSEYAAKRIAEQVKAINKLVRSSEFKNQIYREVEFEYKLEDANRHADELGYIIDDYQAKELVELYLNKYQDCNLDENTNWEQLIEDYAKDNNLEKYNVMPEIE